MFELGLLLLTALKIRGLGKIQNFKINFKLLKFVSSKLILKLQEVKINLYG